ncbi:MAG TPA: hypothetical protein DCG54_08445 [Anaerolineae bacterium]|jgi:hypothetical protein|nr:hypothetical protein [Anaerolineae bacterium]
MSEQHHIIKRQLIELTIRGSAEAQPFQDEISRVYRQRIVPLIDRRCSELSGPDRLYRIETLDLDLGALNPDWLEEDFVAKVDAALSRELAAQIHAQEQAASQSTGGNSKTQSQLELFALFVRTGNLPWWADASRTGLLAENLEHLLEEIPQALRRLLLELAREPRARQRMIHHYSDQQLTSLSGLLVPTYQAALERDFRELLDGLATAGSQSSLRQTLWNNILIVAGLGGQEYANLTAFYQAVLTRIAAALGSVTLLSDLHRALQAGRITINSQLAGMIAEIAETSPTTAETIRQALATRLAQLQAGTGPLSATWAKLNNLIPQFPAALQAALLAALNDFPGSASAQSIARRILQVLETKSDRQPDPGAEISELVEILRAAADDLDIPDQTAAPPIAETTVDLRFSQTDELPISNAGLVILWPFLAHFFSHLSLLDEEHRFKDFAARQRAVGLLQVLATREASPPEYLLPLNKLLCGLAADEVFEFGAPLLESEARECENLLEAVIAQAPILREMTADGFRGSFLLRSGILSARDGMGLLRVERQTYDIVLDRFPWGWEWVKLSWMEAPLRVEW